VKTVPWDPNHRALGSATREDRDTEHQDPGTEHRARAQTAAAAAALLQSGFEPNRET